MNLVAVKAPAARVTFPGKPPELLDALFGVIAARQLLQVIADQLIEAFAESVCLLASAGNDLIIDGQGNIHSHSIRAHVICGQLGKSGQLPHAKTVTERKFAVEEVRLSWRPPGVVWRRPAYDGRGKFVAGLKSAFPAGQLHLSRNLASLAQPTKVFASWLRPLFRKDWIVYPKPPFGGPEYLRLYLGHYNHQVAIPTIEGLLHGTSSHLSSARLGS